MGKAKFSRYYNSLNRIFIPKDQYKNYYMYLMNCDEVDNKYVEKLRRMGKEQREEVLNKVILKYGDDISPLHVVIAKYAALHGKPLVCDNFWLRKRYDIDGKFVVEKSPDTIVLRKARNDEVLVHDYKNEKFSVYGPGNSLVARSDCQLVLDDIKVQIREKGLKGYYVVYDELGAVIEDL